MARVGIVIAVVLSMLSYASSQCSVMTVAEAEQLLISTLNVNADAYTFTIHDLNTNCLSASNTRGYSSTAVAVNYTMADASDSTTDVAQMTCLCDSSSMTWNTDSSVNFIVPSSNPSFGGGVLSAEELLTIDADKSCSVCAFSSSPIFCVRKCIYIYPENRCLRIHI